MKPALYIMIGGFLGAGKTTAILGLARRLSARGLSAGLISNDQSVGLVDSALMANSRFPAEEITGGCFCCRFNSLLEASERLTREASPDVFLAEPVGSCTDLIASVIFPLRKIYGQQFRVAPLSVLVDPVRAERVLGLTPGGNFSEKVLYVYRKQLEEAELIVINKTELLDEPRLERLESALRTAFPGTGVYRVSAREGTGIDEWLQRIQHTASTATQAAEVDYEVYAEGEALLGWLNASVTLRSTNEFDGNEWLRDLAARVRAALRHVEIAHLKMTLMPALDGNDLGVVNLVRSDGAVEMSHTLKAPLAEGDLLVNLRAEGDPEDLRMYVLEAITGSGCAAQVRNIEYFRPAKPQPTHRMASV
jgi:G3E family GTPase